MVDAYQGSLERWSDASYVHVLSATGYVDGERAGLLSTGDAVPLTSAGGRHLRSSVGPGAHILIWEATDDLKV